MIVLKNENIRPFDVDDTLILQPLMFEGDTRHVSIVDPVPGGNMIRMRVHEPNVRLLEEEVQRGSQVIVWSRGGWQWARNVIQALGLDVYRIIIMSKPSVYFDDKDVGEWMKDRVYLDPNTSYKNNLIKRSKNGL